MAELKRNTINQILFTMVDKTDFATLETSLASNFTVKVFGVTNGAAGAAAISTVASLVSKVGSGVYRVPLTAARCNFDQILIRVAHASAATQMLWFDLKSRVLDASGMSDIASQVWAHTKATSLLSRTSNINSFVVNFASSISDIGSQVWANVKGASVASLVSQLRVRMNYSNVSDLASKITSMVWAANINGASMASNIASQVWGHAVGTQVTSRILVAQSFLSDIDSALSSQYTKAYSAATAGASRALLTQSLASDTHSAVSTLLSRVPKMAATASVLLVDYNNIYGSMLSGISDLTSKVYARQASQYVAIYGSMLSGISDVTSKVYARQASQYTILSSRIRKDIATTSLLSDVRSDIRSLVSGLTAATLTVSDISDIASRVWSYHTASQTGAGTVASKLQKNASLVALNLNMKVSDVYSLVSDVYSAMAIGATASDVASAVWAQHYNSHKIASSFGSVMDHIGKSGVSLRVSDLSDLRSAISVGPVGAVTLTASDISDIASRVWSEKYTTHGGAASSFGSAFRVNLSTVSDIQSALDSQYAIVGSRVNKVVASKSALSHLRSLFVVDYAYESDLLSKLGSRVTKGVALASNLLIVQSIASDAHSAAAQANSRTLVGQSFLSDIDSALTSRFSDFHSLLSTTLGASDLYSKVGKLVSRITIAPATQSKLDLVQSMVSDLDSALTSRFSDLHSLLSTTMGASDLYSKVGKLASRVTKAVATNSQLSDLISDLNSDLRSVFMDGGTGVKICASDMSDLRSAVAAGPATANTTSIARAVWARAMASHTAAGTAGSMQSNVESLTIKLNSRVRKDVATTSLLSDVRSDIRSLMSTAGAAVTVSNISDIASAVWGFKWNTNSVASSFGSAFEKVMSLVSDIDSALSSQYTKVYSLVGAGGLNTSAISDIASAVWGQHYPAHVAASTFGSAFRIVASNVSDTQSALDSQYTKAYSLANKTGSQLLLVKSIASDAQSAAILAASNASQAYSVALINRSFLSDIDSALTSRFSDINSLLRSVIQSRISDIESALDSQFAIGQMLNASGLSDVGSVVDARLDAAFTDATTLNANGLKDRIRTQGWILRNKMKVNDTSGRVDLFKDDNATTAFSVTAGLTDNGVSTLRKRLE